MLHHHSADAVCPCITQLRDVDSNVTTFQTFVHSLQYLVPCKGIWSHKQHLKVVLESSLHQIGSNLHYPGVEHGLLIFQIHNFCPQDWQLDCHEKTDTKPHNGNLPVNRAIEAHNLCDAGLACLASKALY